VTAVLFTCAGQRVDIVTAFREAGATTISADVDPLAPALYHSDRRAIVPPVDDPGYVAALRNLVELHEVRLIVRLTDLAHLVLADHRGELDGAVVLVPEPESIHRCADKYLAHLFFEAEGIGTPPTWLPDELPDDLRYPVLVKARRGFGSRHIYRAADRAELDFFLRYTAAESMVQSQCLGEEFSVDVFCDLEGRCLAAIPRTMIESKGGESIKGMTIADPDLIEHGRRVSGRCASSVRANVQCFQRTRWTSGGDRRQPRFGGGFRPADGGPGISYPELALALAVGERRAAVRRLPRGVVADLPSAQVIWRRQAAPSSRWASRAEEAVTPEA
jgi:carbamoyl-phosphate synthase large subunit